MPDHDKQLVDPQMRSELSNTRLFKLYIYGDLRFINNIQSCGLSVNDTNFYN